MSDDTWEQIKDADNKDQWASLVELCSIHLNRNPKHFQARIPQAIALQHLNRFNEAISLLQLTYEEPNASPKCKSTCQRQLGRTFQEMGRFDDARRAFEEAHRLEPNSTIPIICRAALDLRVGEFTTAREWLNRALECSEGDFDEAHFNIGRRIFAKETTLKRSNTTKKRSRLTLIMTSHGNDWLMQSALLSFESSPNESRMVRLDPRNLWLLLRLIAER